jgi:glycosyltransferase involved in cell wall biosynthesis
MMRVAILVDAGIRDSSSAVFIPAIRNLVERLSASFELTVFSLRLPDNRVDEFRCGNANVKFVSAYYNDNALKRIVAFRNAFAAEHRTARFDLVHGIRGFPCGFAAALIGKRHRIPSIVSLQGGETAAIPHIGYGHMLRQPLRAITRWTCEQASAVTVLTKFQEAALRSFRITPKQLLVIPHGADLDAFSNAKKKPVPPPMNFLHVANLNEVKDQTTLLRAFALISQRVDARLRIVGEDQLNGRIQKLARKLDIAERVEFIGFVPYQFLAEHFHWAHALLHTSFYEGQGVVIAEAAASRTLICGTRVGLISDLGENCAVAVPVGDHVGLDEKVNELLANPSRFDAIRERAFKWASEHSVDWTASQFSELYWTTVETHQR